MKLDPLKVSIKELEVKSKQQKTVIQFSNVDVTVKTSYLKKLKDPVKYVQNLWHKKTETQIRHLSKEERRGNEIRGLARLQEKMGFEITQPTASIIDQQDERENVFSEVLRKIDEKKDTTEYQLIITKSETGIRIDNI